jgi:peptide deformylase
MYDAPGVGLAGNQVGVQRRIFTYDDDSGAGPRTILNPVIVETSGEWTYEEGCLSVPGLYFEITRPSKVHLQGMGLDGESIDIEADDLLGRILQHETDHLNGLLLLDRLEPDQRKRALKALREQALNPAGG